MMLGCWHFRKMKKYDRNSTIKRRIFYCCVLFFKVGAGAHMRVCVCVCVCVRARVCARARVCVRVHVLAYVPVVYSGSKKNNLA